MPAVIITRQLALEIFTSILGDLDYKCCTFRCNPQRTRRRRGGWTARRLTSYLHIWPTKSPICPIWRNPKALVFTPRGAKGEQVRAAEPRGPLDLRTVEEKKSVTTMVDVVEKRLRAARVAGQRDRHG
ncbi:hypothetical protein YQE_03027, partial [Dendroctonus ponderosae]